MQLEAAAVRMLHITAASSHIKRISYSSIVPDAFVQWNEIVIC